MTNVVGSDDANTAEESRPASNGDKHTPRVIILMGVSGTGKSTLGRALAETLRMPFIDGDDLHPPANVAKMARGEPLDDADRLPWLEAVRSAAVARATATATAAAATADPTASESHGAGAGVLVACSALKRAYRTVLRGGAGGPGGWGPDPAAPLPLPTTTTTTYFVYLEGDRAVLQARMAAREGHFMKAGMLASQLDALESPVGEPGVAVVPVGLSTAAQVRAVVDAMRAWDSDSDSSGLGLGLGLDLGLGLGLGSDADADGGWPDGGGRGEA